MRAEVSPMPFDNSPEREDKCAHINRHDLPMNGEIVNAFREAYPELFSELTPIGAYHCPDCDLFWLVFPL